MLYLALTVEVVLNLISFLNTSQQPSLKVMSIPVTGLVVLAAGTAIAVQSPALTMMLLLPVWLVSVVADVWFERDNGGLST